MKLFSALSRFFSKRENGASRPADVVSVPTDGDPVLDLLAATLRKAGVVLEAEHDLLRLPSGIGLRVELLEVDPRADGNVRTVSRIVATHAEHFPHGLPEFQHAGGRSAEDALVNGFSAWATLDLVTLQDAIRDKPEDCTFVDMKFPSAHQTNVRRVVFGPISHMAVPLDAPQEEEHDFCPCCFVTKNLAVFRPVIDAAGTVGIRLFAMRRADGEIAADCRVNGEDYPEGVAQLNEYVRTWPVREDMEFRKQYVVVRSVDREPVA
jgi:hypothetical protein